MRSPRENAHRAYRRGAVLGLTVGEVFMLLSFVLLLLILLWRTELLKAEEELLEVQKESRILAQGLVEARRQADAVQAFSNLASHERETMTRLLEAGLLSSVMVVLALNEVGELYDPAKLIDQATQPGRAALLNALVNAAEEDINLLTEVLSGNSPFEQQLSLLDEFGGLDPNILTQAVTLARTADPREGELLGEIAALQGEARIVAFQAGADAGTSTSLTDWVAISEVLAELNWNSESVTALSELVDSLGDDPSKQIEELRGQVRQSLDADQDRSASMANAIRVTLGDSVARRGGIISDDGSITLPGETLFRTGDSDLTSAMRGFLDEICEPWFSVLNSLEFSVGEIRVEGHASTVWQRGSSEKNAYMGNLGLSQARAREVLSYCLDQTWGSDLNSWARQRAIAIGYSSSNLVLDETGQEDRKASQRVVLSADPDRATLITSLEDLLRAD